VVPGSPGHHLTRIGLGFAFEAVGGVGDPEAFTVVRAGHRSLALLDDVGEFVGEGVRVGAAVADDDVAAAGVGAGADLGGGALSGRAGVQTHIGEVGSEAALHVGAGGVVQGPPT
jgi:hypothetical protein